MIICSPQLGLAPKSTLGGEVFDREILLGLAEKGIKIDIILPQGKDHDKNVKNWHVTNIAFSHFPAMLGNILFLPQLFRIYKKNKFELLRIHQPQFLGLGAIVFKIINPKVKILANYHQFRETRFFIFSKIINNFWDGIICDSENVKKKIVKTYNIDPDKIAVVRNGIPSYLKPTPKNKRLTHEFDLEGKFVLLFMGLLIRRKNPLFLLAVLSQVLKVFPNTVLIYWGDGPLENEIKKIAKSLNVLKNIRFVKPIYGHSKNDIHNLADVFVHPSLDEGFALAPLEAMACAKPIIINRLHSAKEAVEEGKNGYLCTANDANSWSEKITKLIKDENLRARFSRYSYQEARKDFSWDQSVQKHLELISQIYKTN